MHSETLKSYRKSYGKTLARLGLRGAGCALALGILPHSALAFVHIHQLKPRLPVSPDNPVVDFLWNGEAPELSDKEEVFEGSLADASDRDIMEALLNEAVSTWNRVETSYIELRVAENSGARLDEEDEDFAIVVDEQQSKAVAAAATPNFISRDSDPSPNEENEHIIHDCDIAVADTKVKAKSLLRTLVHELGHCLGLGHPHSSYHSIMSYASIDGEEAKLALDDEAGVSFLYPEPGQSQDVRALTGCGSLGLGAGGARGAWLLLGLPLVVCLLRHRRASKPQE